jgi:predicted O-methyltransferase YrrM
MAEPSGPDALPEASGRILADFSEAEENAKCDNHHWYGGRRQRERVAALAEWCLLHHEGDILEIGACQGICTRLLAEVAKRHGRKVVVIDPWIPGTQDCQGEQELKDFKRNTDGFREHIDVIRDSSMAPAVFEQLKDRSIAFSFVDGLHTFEACWSDFLLVRKTSGLVVADDARYNVEVLMAARIRARQFGWQLVQPPDVREAIMFAKQG